MQEKGYYYFNMDLGFEEFIKHNLRKIYINDKSQNFLDANNPN